MACRRSLERRALRLTDADEAHPDPDSARQRASVDTLLRLPQPARTVLVLACLCQRKCDDIGRILDLDRAVVATKVRESLLFARHHLESLVRPADA